jgi:hypothetical protein
MSTTNDEQTNDERQFLDALKSLNVTSHEAMALALELDPSNPFEFLELANAGAIRKQAFKPAFDRLLKRNISWHNLRRSLGNLALAIKVQEDASEFIRDAVEPLPVFKTIAIAYCGEFKHKHLLDRFLPALDCAHRSPTLCASQLIAEGGSVVTISTDEWLKVPPKASTAVRNVSILYLCTHGRVEKGQYQAALSDGYWQPTSSDFGVNGPKVLALDTCHGANRTPPYQNFWSGALKGTSVRLLLACEGPIVMDRLSTKRGYAFADNMSQRNASISIADAWLQAVRSTSTTGTSRPVAIGLGDNTSDAKAMLALTLNDLLSPQKRPSALGASASVYFADRH